MAVNWTRKELEEALKKNPAIRINSKYSMPPREAKKASRGRLPSQTVLDVPFYEKEFPIRIHLPYVPPSLNKTTGGNRYAVNAAKQDFIDEVRWDLKLAGVKKFRGKVRILMLFYFPVYRERDRENFMKWIKDAIKGWVFVDDSTAFIEWESVEFPKGKKRTELLVEPVSTKWEEGIIFRKLQELGRVPGKVEAR